MARKCWRWEMWGRRNKCSERKFHLETMHQLARKSKTVWYSTHLSQYVSETLIQTSIIRCWITYLEISQSSVMSFSFLTILILLHSIYSFNNFFFRFLYVLVTLPSSGDALKDRDYRIRALTSQLQWQRGYNKQIINNFVSFYVENCTNVTLDWVGKGIFFEKMSVKKKPAQNWRKMVRRYKPVVQDK